MVHNYWIELIIKTIMKDKIKKILKKNLQDRFDKYLSYWPRVEMENYIEQSVNEIIKLIQL
jgi:hypothetical protein